MLFTTSLREIIGTSQESGIKDAIDAFLCKDKDVESFLKNKALNFEQRNKSRTYLVLDNDDFKHGNAVIVAYFTLSLKSLEFRNTLSKNKIKDIDGFSKEVGGVAIVLIGQLGKNETKAKEVSGSDLLELCMEIVDQVKDLIGGRYVLIECHQIQKVVNFYLSNGFEKLQLDKDDNYLQMVRRL